MNVLGRIFLISRKDRRKDGFFFMRCRRTYVLNKLKYLCGNFAASVFASISKEQWTLLENIVSGFKIVNRMPLKSRNGV